MNLLLTSQLLTRACLGMMFLILLFAFSIITVLGIKTLANFIKDKLFNKPCPPPAEKPKRVRKPIKSIQIDPNEDTRIIFRKSS